MVKLCPVQMFARDVRTLLRLHQGRLALSHFEASYAQHFGVGLVAASYGYPSVVALLQAIPHVATIKGKSQRRTLLLCQDFQGQSVNFVCATCIFFWSAVFQFRPLNDFWVPWKAETKKPSDPSITGLVPNITNSSQVFICTLNFY